MKEKLNVPEMLALGIPETGRNVPHRQGRRVETRRQGRTFFSWRDMFYAKISKKMFLMMTAKTYRSQKVRR
jgi:hypothetical protein